MAQERYALRGEFERLALALRSNNAFVFDDGSPE